MVDADKEAQLEVAAAAIESTREGAQPVESTIECPSRPHPGGLSVG
jgi:hypothetical protein